MKEQMMERYMNAVAELAKKFDNYTDSNELADDYRRVSDEVASRTEMLVRDLGLTDVCEYTNQSLNILREAFLKAAEKTDRLGYENKTNEAIEFISNLL